MRHLLAHFDLKNDRLTAFHLTEEGDRKAQQTRDLLRHHIVRNATFLVVGTVLTEGVLRSLKLSLFVRVWTRNTLVLAMGSVLWMNVRRRYSELKWQLQSDLLAKRDNLLLLRQ